ncbi:MAG: HAD family hydrolase [Verrucomicrobiota bacterium]
MNDLTWLKLITDRRQGGPVTLPDDAAPRFAKLDGIRAVVFDIYGTLFSSGVGDISLATEDNRDALLRETVIANGIHPTALAGKLRLDEQLHSTIHRHQDTRRMEGIEYPEVDIRHVWQDFLNQLEALNLMEPSDNVIIEKLVLDYETRVNPTQPMPGLLEVLAELRERGLILSIISNAQFYTPFLFEAFLGKTIEELGFSEACNVWSYAELEGKPSERLYECAAERLASIHQIQPEQCLYVGNDMRNDIWPAQALGFKTALFAGDRLSLRRREDHPACKDLQADLEITELAQILQIIDHPVGGDL